MTVFHEYDYIHGVMYIAWKNAVVPLGRFFVRENLITTKICVRICIDFKYKINGKNFEDLHDLPITISSRPLNECEIDMIATDSKLGIPFDLKKIKYLDWTGKSSAEYLKTGLEILGNIDWLRDIKNYK